MRHLPLKIPRFEAPFDLQRLPISGLSEEQTDQVRRFAQYGYLIVDSGIEGFDEKADKIVRNLAGKYGQEGYVGDPKRIQDAWKFDEGVRELACSASILKLLEVLYGRRAIPFQTLNFPVGTQQRTHSDTMHFDSFPQRFMCGVWVAFEDTDENNGPLHYYPGSHRLPVFHLGDFGITANGASATSDKGRALYREYEERAERLIQMAGFARKELHIKKGQAFIWSANLYHGGSPVRNVQRTRHSQVTHYNFEGCMYYSPRESDIPLKNIAWRSIVDITTGRSVVPEYNGQAMDEFVKDPPASFRQRLSFHWKRWRGAE